MTIVFDARELWRKLGTRYGGVEDTSKRHPCIVFEVLSPEGLEEAAPIVVRQQHSSRGDLPPFIARGTARNLGLSTEELKQVERCGFDRDLFQERLSSAS